MIKTIMALEEVNDDILERITNITFKLTNVYPNVILNKLDFKKTSIPLQLNCIKTSKDVSKILSEQYVFKKQCFDNPVVVKLVETLLETNININLLMNALPKIINDLDIPAENVKFLYIYLMLFSLHTYLNVEINGSEEIVTRPIDDEELIEQDVENKKKKSLSLMKH